MRVARLFSRGYMLVLISGLELTAPFLRVLIMTHFLSLQEVGFASALVAYWSTFELVSDFAIYRFVFSTPRDQYDAALSGAHGLSVTRGIVVGSLAALGAPWAASLLSAPTAWPSFAILGGFIAIRALENLAPRVAERDYDYRPQLAASLVSNVISLTVLFLWMRWRPGIPALLASLGIQTLLYVVMSHVVSKSPYRPHFGTAQYWAAFRFGYPLAFNGAGLAMAGQADRMVVGPLLGLSDLGVYSIVLLASNMPTSMIGRISTSLGLSALHNAAHDQRLFDLRLRLAAIALPLIFMLYALANLTLLNPALTLVFGHKFEVSKVGLVILGFAAFARLARGDPMAFLLLHSGRTKRLAAGNLVAASSLLFVALFAIHYRSIESAFFGRLAGETVSFAATIYLSWPFFKAARSNFVKSMAIGIALVAVTGVLVLTTPVGNGLVASSAAFAILLVVFLLLVLGLALPLASEAFPATFAGAGKYASIFGFAKRNVPGETQSTVRPRS